MIQSKIEHVHLAKVQWAASSAVAGDTLKADGDAGLELGDGVGSSSKTDVNR